MKQKNSLQKGSVRVLVFRDRDAWYAAGLEFNIVETGTTPQEAMILVLEAVQGYVESAKKIKAWPHILNQAVDSEYEAKWRRAVESKQQDRSVFFAGRMNIGQGRALVPA